MKRHRFAVLLLLSILLFAGETPQCVAEDLVKKTGFDSFCKEWLRTLRAQGCYSPDRPCRTYDSSNPGVTATCYSQVEEITSMIVKKTPVSQSPYVGILKYSVVKYCSDEKKTNQFKPCGRQSVTEIFSYRNGKWTY